MNPTPPLRPPGEPDSLRPHTFDGIQEYDKRLPNWWLYTLYGAIAFSVVYWFAYQIARVVPTDEARVDAALARIAAAKMSSSIDVTDDKLFWEMSRNPVFVAAGKQTYTSLCVACHTPNLTGSIGPSLVSTEWLHGGTPKEIFKTVNEGVPAKGMVAWGPVIGQKKVAEAVAYVLSHHREGEPVTINPKKPVGLAPTPPPGG
ncbi:MAG: c-type cytochrome [Opitutae bacterium]|nr:c-type cytochrome [Opitutae bacterium]